MRPTPEQYLERANNRISKVLENLGESFPTKAAKKHCKDDVNRCYDDVFWSFPHKYDENENLVPCARWNKQDTSLELPFQLCHVRDRHVEVAMAEDPERGDMIASLVSIYNQIKETPVDRKMPKVDDEQTKMEKRIRKDIGEEMKRLKKCYLEAVDLGRHFGYLPVTANAHYVTNRFGTSFTRVFYYLNGKLTRLNIILAAAQKLAEEKKNAK